MQFIDGRRFSCRGAIADSHGHAVQQTTETPLLLLNTVIDVLLHSSCRSGLLLQPLISGSQLRCWVFAFGVQVFGIFWVITSGLVPYAALPGSTVDTCRRQYVRLSEEFRTFLRENIHVVAQVQISFGSFPIEILHLQYIDKVVVFVCSRPVLECRRGGDSRAPTVAARGGPGVNFV